jgi:hypothetical protein
MPRLVRGNAAELKRQRCTPSRAAGLRASGACAAASGVVQSVSHTGDPNEGTVRGQLSGLLPRGES